MMLRTDMEPQHLGWQVSLTTVAAMLCVSTLLLLVALHVAFGARPIPVADVVQAFINFQQDSMQHLVVVQLRLPRALAAALAGSALAVAGVSLQAVTRNPLADPGLLGLLSGSALCVVLFGVLGHANFAWVPVQAAVGALFAGCLVWWLAGRMPGGATPLMLTLSGATVTALLSAIITLLHLFNDQSFNELRVWLVGSFTGQRWQTLFWVLPMWLLGMLLIFPQGRVLTILTLGEDTAGALGVEPRRHKVIILVGVILLTASAVALAGPLGFVGLVIPHVVRLFTGGDYRTLLLFSALIGAGYVLGIDLLARVLFAPKEIAAGLLTVLIGAPWFMALVLRYGRAGASL
ncbi:MAG: iron ABC transporter permease [Reinekea sp.]|nr:iron ABC transporter permease [Reinekea sp.]